MGSKKSLRYLIGKYAILELIYTFFVLVFFYSILNILIINGLVYPANYADREAEKLGIDFHSDDWSFKDIPFYYDFLYLENGKLIKNTIDEKYDDLVKEALINERSSSEQVIGSNIFRAFIKEDKSLVIKYKMSIIPTSEKIYKVFSDFEIMYILLALLIWILGFSLLLIRSSNLLKREIEKIAFANENINKMELNYKRNYSKYKEIDGILHSIDILAKNLKNSLDEQWDMQIKQKELIEAVTHDIRTPITLIKGNIELLKEENPDLASERFADISNGMFELEKYIERLKDFSYEMVGEKEIVSRTVISYWVEILSGICRSNGFDLDPIKTDASDIFLDKEAVATALQNIAINSIQNADKASKISAIFTDRADEFSIIIRDEGSGFDENLLPKLGEKFISSKAEDGDYKHGLGLSIVKKVVEANKGLLYLRNYHEAKSGAEVEMLFKKERC